MADRVKGITVEIGGDVTGLNKALKGTNDQIRTTQSQLKDVEKLLKLDPTNTTLLEQKQRLLADAIGETESKLDTLKAANDQVAGSVKNYDAWKKAYDPIQEEIKETNEKLKELKAQRQELNDSGKMNTDEFKNLQAEIDKTTADLKDLKSEAKKVSEEFGNPISQSQYDALQREIIDTEASLRKLRESASEGMYDFPDWDTELKSARDDLKEINSLLEFDTSNVTLTQQKFKVLSRAIEAASEKLELLKEDQEAAWEQLENGEISSRQYEAITRKVIAAQNELSKLEKEAEEVNSALHKIDEDPVEDVENAADKAGDALEDAGKEASNFGDYLKAGAIIEGVKGIAGAISDLSQETQEYRKIMGTLETSSEQAGYTAQQTAQTYKQLYGVLGDDQTTATTVANLQALELSQGKLTQLTDAAIGAWAKYGDSIPIDGLAEAINETIRGGTVTGNFADVLNWGSKEGETFGVMLKENTKANEEWNKAVADAETAEDYFNLALQNCSTEAERANLVLQAMTDQGLVSAADAWRKNNEDIVAANEAQSDFMEKAAELSERVAPAIQAVKEGGNDLLQLFLDLTSEVDFDAMAETINQVFAAVEGLITFLVDNQETVLTVISAIAAGLAALKLAELISTISQVTSGVTTLSQAFPLLGNAISILTNPIFLVTAAVVAFVALIATKGDEIQAILQKLDDWLQGVFATDWTELFGPILGETLNFFFATVKNIWDSVKQVFDGVIDFIRGVFTGDWERAWNGVVEIFSGLMGMLETVVKAPINGVIWLLNTAISAINDLIAGLNSISFKLPDWLGGGSFGINIPSIPRIPYLAKGGMLEDGMAVVGEAGPELLTVGNGRAVVQPLPGNTGKIESLLGSIDSRIGGQGELTIVVPVSLNGRIIGEETYRYIQNRGRANG